MTNELQTVDASTAVADRFAPYSSIRGGDMETRKTIFNALSNATPLSKHLDTPFAVRHIVRMPVESLNEETGELDRYMRTVLITDTGEAFSASSKGIDNSFNLILATLGDPSRWDEAVPMVAREEGAGKMKYLTLALA